MIFDLAHQPHKRFYISFFCLRFYVVSPLLCQGQSKHALFFTSPEVIWQHLTACKYVPLFTINKPSLTLNNSVLVYFKNFWFSEPFCMPFKVVDCIKKISFHRHFKGHQTELDYYTNMTSI